MRDNVEGDAGAVGEVEVDFAVYREYRCGLEGERSNARLICLMAEKFSTVALCLWVGDSRCGAPVVWWRGEYSKSIIATPSAVVMCGAV